MGLTGRDLRAQSDEELLVFGKVLDGDLTLRAVKCWFLEASSVLRAHVRSTEGETLHAPKGHLGPMGFEVLNNPGHRCLVYSMTGILSFSTQ